MVTRAQIQQARKTDLYDFLIKNYPNRVSIEGNSLHLADNHSLAVRQGYCGFIDFATDQKGNSIDFLTEVFGMSFQDAVLALCGSRKVVGEAAGVKASSSPKPMPNSDNKRVFGYLLHRGIDAETIQELIDSRLLYEDTRHNAVFMNRSKDHAEIVGTLPGVRFKNNWRSGTWHFNSPSATEKPRTAFVTESAVDAISLYLLRREDAFYVSIGGVNNQKGIDMLKRICKDAVIAVDRDDAGEQCRIRNNDLRCIIPGSGYKDWNEMLNDNRLTESEVNNEEV